MKVLEYIQILERLRKAWHGNEEAQAEVNKCLARLNELL